MTYCAPLRGCAIDRHLKCGSPGNDVWFESRNDRGTKAGDLPLDHFWDNRVLAFNYDTVSHLLTISFTASDQLAELLLLSDQIRVGNRLIRYLRAAARALDRGQERMAIVRPRLFKIHVAVLMWKDQIPLKGGQRLIDAAIAIIDQVNDP